MFEKESNGMSEEERTDFVIALKRKMCLENGKVTDADVYFQGVKAGYNKANEWHFVKDGKYPTDEKYVQVLYQDCDKIKVYDCVYDIHAKNWLYYNLDDMMLELFPFTNIIAWKEIVLPELPKDISHLTVYV